MLESGSGFDERSTAYACGRRAAARRARSWHAARAGRVRSRSLAFVVALVGHLCGGAAAALRA